MQRGSGGAGVADPAILFFGSIQLEVDSTGRCRYAWGYSPFPGWVVAKLPAIPQPSTSACVVVDVEPGDVAVVTESTDTASTIDPDKGSVWVRSASAVHEPYDWAGSIAPGVVLLGWEHGGAGGLLLEATNSSEILQAVSGL